MRPANSASGILVRLLAAFSLFTATMLCVPGLFAEGGWLRNLVKEKLVPPEQSSIQFSYGGNVSQIPAQIVGSLVLVPVRVNGSQPSWFLLDTARRASAIDDVRAVAVGLYSPSANDKSPKSFSSANLQFPSLRISIPSLALGSFGDLSARIGHEVDGALGADVLNQLIIRIDYARQSVQIFDPASFHYGGKGLQFPLRIVGAIPAIDGKVSIHHRGNFRGLFALSIGQTEPIEFSEHFANAQSLASLPERTLPFSTADAANDTDVRARLGRVHAIQFGKITFADPIAIIPAKSKSGGTVPHQFICGLGGEILNRFTMVLDYPAHVLILEPNRHFEDFFTADMSGLTLIAIPPAFNKFEVARIAGKSPAAQAGIMIGDMIEAADGSPASDYTLDDLRAMLRESGTSHEIVVMRNGRSIKFTLNLKPLI